MPLHLEIVTPERLAYEDDVDLVVVPGVDTLLLGCTHYPLVRWAIEEIAGPGVRVVDSATTTALAVREVLDSHGLRSQRGEGEGTHRVFATGPSQRFLSVARALFSDEAFSVEEAVLG